MRYFFVFLLIICVSFSFVPPRAKAEVQAKTPPTLTPAARAVLLEEIKRLVEEVQRLQSLLASRTWQTNRQPHRAVLFDFPLKAHYFVDNLKLVPVQPSATIRLEDQVLFSKLVAVIGAAAVGEHIREWRIFAEERGGIGGFVESIPVTKGLIMGVNESAFPVPFSPGDEEALRDLYLHEYAHIVLLERSDLRERFATRFWTNADYRQTEKINLALAQQPFTKTQATFGFDPERFVSFYAQLSLDEDLAETFVAFVKRENFSDSKIVEQKQKFFLADPTLSDLRLQLRQNLGW